MKYKMTAIFTLALSFYAKAELSCSQERTALTQACQNPMQTLGCSGASGNTTSNTTPTFTLSGGVLKVEGTSGNDRLTVTESGGNFVAYWEQAGSTQTQNFSTSGVTSIELWGYQGDDDLEVEIYTAVSSVKIEAGSGIDQVDSLVHNTTTNTIANVGAGTTGVSTNETVNLEGGYKLQGLSTCHTNSDDHAILNLGTTDIQPCNIAEVYSGNGHTTGNMGTGNGDVKDGAYFVANPSISTADITANYVWVKSYSYTGPGSNHVNGSDKENLVCGGTGSHFINGGAQKDRVKLPTSTSNQNILDLLGNRDVVDSGAQKTTSTLGDGDDCSWQMNGTGNSVDCGNGNDYAYPNTITRVACEAP